MPRRKAKKEEKKKRRAAMQQVRQEKGWQPPPSFEGPQADMMADMLTLFPQLGGDAPLGMDVAESLVDLVYASEDLAEEPEFQDIYFHPIEALNAFDDVQEKRGLSPQAIDALDDEQKSDLSWELTEDVLARLLDEQVRHRILSDLERLWQRVRQSGDGEKAARAAAILAFVQANEDEELWSSFGLVLALVRRSVLAGLEMGQVAARIDLGASGEEAEEELDASFLLERMAEPDLGDAMGAILDRYPGLREYMARVDEQVWEEGVKALLTGELFLGLFSPEEVEEGAERFARVLEDLGVELGDTDVSHEVAGPAFDAVGRYVDSLITPEFLEDVRQDVLELLDKPFLAAHWQPFLFMLLDELQDQDALEQARLFLIPAFVGEMMDRFASEEDGEQADDEEEAGL